MLYPPGFYYVKKPKRFVILSSDKSSERNLSSFFDIKKPRRIEHLQSEEPFSSDPYFSFTWTKLSSHYWNGHILSEPSVSSDFRQLDLIRCFFLSISATAESKQVHLYGMIPHTDYEHTMAKSLFLCDPNSNPNPKQVHPSRKTLSQKKFKQLHEGSRTT